MSVLGGFFSSGAVHTTTAAFLLAFPALFSIVNPFGAALIFAQATEGRSKTEIQALARLVSFYSFMLMIVSLWFGGAVLAFFGITVSALRVAGGLVVAVSAWELLQKPENTEARKERQALQDGRTVQNPNWSESAFFPLAMPFTVGPGTIAVAIALARPVRLRPRHGPMVWGSVLGPWVWCCWSGLPIPVLKNW